MTLNESIVEDASLEWFGEQTRCARTLIPAFSQWEKEEDREAIRRLNPGIPEEARATDKEFMLVQNTSKGG